MHSLDSFSRITPSIGKHYTADRGENPRLFEVEQIIDSFDPVIGTASPKMALVRYFQGKKEPVVISLECFEEGFFREVS